MSGLKLQDAPMSIQKGTPLKLILDRDAVEQIAYNLSYVYEKFDSISFVNETLNEIEPLSLTERSKHISEYMRAYLPSNYTEAIAIILKSLTPPLDRTKDNGLASMLYMPHCNFIAKYGIDPQFNNKIDPFEKSMEAQYELTKRFTCEFSIRPYIEQQEKRTLKVLYNWMQDKDPHVRRLCSEGTRPRLPWATKLSSFIQDPKPALVILEELKDDDDLYVRRSVANHIGDIAKDHIDLALSICDKWLSDASKERKWIIRHALRNPVKKGNNEAIELRAKAK